MDFVSQAAESVAHQRYFAMSARQPFQHRHGGTR
jgi:hypothetical protein